MFRHDYDYTRFSSSSDGRVPTLPAVDTIETVAEEHVRELNLAVRQLLQSGREMQSAAARQLGLRTTDVQAMDLVTAAEGRISPAELADRLGIRSASASVLIDRLVTAGHLERAKADERAGSRARQRTRVEITAHARTEIRQTLQDVNEGFGELARDLSPEQAEAVLTFLERGTEILRKYAETAGGATRPTGRPAETGRGEPSTSSHH